MITKVFCGFRVIEKQWSIVLDEKLNLLSIGLYFEPMPKAKPAAVNPLQASLIRRACEKAIHTFSKLLLSVDPSTSVKAYLSSSLIYYKLGGFVFTLKPSMHFKCVLNGSPIPRDAELGDIVDEGEQFYTLYDAVRSFVRQFASNVVSHDPT